MTNAQNDRFYAVTPEGERQEITGVEAIRATCEFIAGKAILAGIEADRTGLAYKPTRA